MIQKSKRTSEIARLSKALYDMWQYRAWLIGPVQNAERWPPHCRPVKIRKMTVQRLMMTSVMIVTRLNTDRLLRTQKMRRKKSTALILTHPRVVIEKNSKAMYNCHQCELSSRHHWPLGDL